MFIRRHPQVLAAALFFALVAVVFGRAVEYPFLNFDDDQYLTANPQIQQFFSPKFFQAISQPTCGLWIPVTMASFALESRLAPGDARVVHTTQLVLHALNAFLVFLIVSGMTGSFGAGLFSGVALAVHPLAVEPVVWISSRKDTLSTFFCLGSLGAYALGRQRNCRKWLGLGLGAFVLALLSKPSVWSIPLAVWVYEKYFSHRKQSSPLIKFYGLAGFLAAMLALQTHSSASAARAVWPDVWALLQRVCYAPLFYLQKIVWPFGFSFSYPRPEFAPDHPSFLYAFAPGLLILGLIGLWVLRRRSPQAVYGVVFFLTALIPTLPWVKISSAIVANRYAYLPLLGIFFSLAILLKAAWRSGCWISRGATLALVLLLVFWASRTYEEVSVWESRRRLYDTFLARHPWNAVLFLKRGDDFREQGQFSEALADYTESIRLRPDVPNGYRNRALVYDALGDPRRALEDMRAAAMLDPQGKTGAVHLLEQATLRMESA